MDTAVISGIGGVKFNAAGTEIVVFFNPGNFIGMVNAADCSLLK
jgi:hypothetical protein